MWNCSCLIFTSQEVQCHRTYIQHLSKTFSCLLCLQIQFLWWTQSQCFKAHVLEITCVEPKQGGNPSKPMLALCISRFFLLQTCSSRCSTSPPSTHKVSSHTKALLSHTFYMTNMESTFSATVGHHSRLHMYRTFPSHHLTLIVH